MAKILIVEDDPLMLRMYQKIFTLEQQAVEIATNGEEALEKVRASSEKPTLILMDIMMPKMNGIDALDKLKANPDTKDIPVVMLTNLAGQQDAEEALLKGAVKYIVKSEHEPKEIVDIVKEVLSGYTRNQIPQAAAPSTPLKPEVSEDPVAESFSVKKPLATPSESTLAAPAAPVTEGLPVNPVPDSTTGTDDLLLKIKS